MPGRAPVASGAFAPPQTESAEPPATWRSPTSGALVQALGLSSDALYQEQQNQPVIVGLAAHIKAFWHRAERARRTVEQQMIEAMLARRGEYTPEKLQQISRDRQPAIYMMVAASKMRQIEALLRDVLIGTGAEKPWTTRPSPDPRLPPHLVAELLGALTNEIQQAMLSGFVPTVQAAQQRLRQMRDEVAPILMEEARRRSERMEVKMEDQLLEGGYLKALDELITDIATYKTAFLAGPLVRRKPRLNWGDDGELQVTEENTLEWERVDPLDMYPAPWATSIDRDDLVRRWRLSRGQLNELIGVDGFDETAIRKVIEEYDQVGHREWLAIDSQRSSAEGKDDSDQNHTGLIDALQYWGSASGHMLLEWGMDPATVPDPAREYQVEAWLVGPHVIKAVLNADPLARRPYYAVSFQMVPGSVWGNAPYDLMHDCQNMCNAAARSLAANLGISSGPQVGVLSNRIPPGEDISEMYPWKIWQFESDPMGSTAAPITFFQPDSNANELLAVFERFSALADEYTGIPRYMTGFETAGAGRTASGMSMMIGNASKVIKQMVGHIDTYVLQPMLERLYYYNMRYVDDPDLKGDVQIVARGALSLVTKEAAQVRNNEVLQIALNSPVAQQIMGVDGVSELLRSTVKTLDHNADRIVPPTAVIKQRMAQELQGQLEAQGLLAAPGGPRPARQGPSPSGQQVGAGAPVTDNFSPQRGV